MKNPNPSLPIESCRVMNRVVTPKVCDAVTPKVKAVLSMAIISGLCAGTIASSTAYADPSVLGFDANALANVSPEDAMAELSPKAEDLKLGQVAVTVISTGIGIASGRLAVQQNTIAGQRSRVHSKLVVDGSSKNISAPPPVLRDLILKDTVHGDVVRIEYVAGNEATLAEAVEDLKHGKQQWEKRLAKLEAEKSALKRDLLEAKGKHAGLPLSEQSRGIRAHFVEIAQRDEEQLTSLKRSIDDANLRLLAARDQLNSAERSLKSASMSPHQIKGGYHVLRDILVDHKTGHELDRFFGRNLDVSPIVSKKHYIKVPHIRIVRIQTPNAAIASNAAKLAKAGAVGFVVSGGLIVEELTVGAIGDRLAGKAATQLAPQARTEPTR